MTEAMTYAVRLPKSTKVEISRLAKQEGITVGEFLATAAIEKLAVMNTARLFAVRREKADMKAFKKIMSRKSGELPRNGDEIPNGYSNNKKKTRK